ncbi:MAG: HEPN domain-containing protein, partial [Planctomycetaceae bacterium]
AIFDVTYEISFRLPLLAALLLEKRGTRCRDLKKHVKKLYNERSKAVHGGEISQDTLKLHVASVRALLARLLTKIIQNGNLPSSEDFDDLTVMADSTGIVPDST